jgi:uncharacterized protein
MRLSKYSIFLPSATNNGQLTLYNTLSGAVFFINREARETLLEGCLDQIEPALLQQLVDDGVVIDEAVDETALCIAKRNRIRYGSPCMRVVVLPSYYCNLRCTYCYSEFVADGRPKKPIMSEATAEKLVRAVRRKVVCGRFNELVVDFTGGGEPLLAADRIIQILDRLSELADAEQFRLISNIVTNGMNMPEGFTDAVGKHDVRFQLTFDGAGEVHNSRRIWPDGRGTYDDTITRAQRLIDSGFQVKIRINVSRRDDAMYAELLDDLRAKVGPGLPTEFQIIVPDGEECRSWSQSAYRTEITNGLPSLWRAAAAKGLNVVLPPLVHPLPCGTVLDSSLVVDSVGDLYCCEALSQDLTFRTGSINDDGTIRHVNPCYSQWMSYGPQMGGECMECALLPACGGECPALLVYNNGSFQQHSCTENKQMLLERIRFQLYRILDNAP